MIVICFTLIFQGMLVGESKLKLDDSLIGHLRVAALRKVSNTEATFPNQASRQSTHRKTMIHLTIVVPAELFSTVRIES